MSGSFRIYAEKLKPLLDTAFTSHLAYLLGNTRPLQPYEGMKILTRGKRIRGTLVCLVAHSLGSTFECALPRAVAIELIQTATLIHDDFVDQHELRRNSPALWTLEGGRKAVLLGDIIFASAIHMMSQLGREDGMIISRSIADISRGAFQELLNPTSFIEDKRDLTDFYNQIIYLKTGVLFGAACQLGAAAAKADSALQQKWYNYGARIGEAYQIADDLNELKRYHVTRSIPSIDMNFLVPIFLYFAGDIRNSITETLKKHPALLQGILLKHCEAVMKAMTIEIEVRLRSAISQIEEDLRDENYSLLARKTPWDIIEMFNEEMSTSSLP